MGRLGYYSKLSGQARQESDPPPPKKKKENDVKNAARYRLRHR